jgi:hypothetical protein
MIVCLKYQLNLCRSLNSHGKVKHLKVLASLIGLDWANYGCHHVKRGMGLCFFAVYFMNVSMTSPG